MNEQSWELPGEDEILEERLRERLKEAARRAPAYLRLTANMVRDDDVPPRAKLTLLAGGVYVVSPIDLIPGFIPVLGQLDDLIVLMVALRSALSMCSNELTEFHLSEVGLTRDDIRRDQETAILGARWIGKKGFSAARIVGERGYRVSAETVREVRNRVGERWFAR